MDIIIPIITLVIIVIVALVSVFMTTASSMESTEDQHHYINLLTVIYTAQYTQFETLMWKFFALYQRSHPDSDFSVSAIENFEAFKNSVGRMSTPELKGLDWEIDVTSKSSITDWIHSRRHTITEMRQFIVDLINSINLTYENDIRAICLLNTIDNYLQAMLDNNDLTIDMLVGKDVSVYLLADEFKIAMEKIPL